MSATITLPRPLVERTIAELKALAETCDHSVNICYCSTWTAIADLTAALSAPVGQNAPNRLPNDLISPSHG